MAAALWPMPAPAPAPVLPAPVVSAGAELVHHRRQEGSTAVESSSQSTAEGHAAAGAGQSGAAGAAEPAGSAEVAAAVPGCPGGSVLCMHGWALLLLAAAGCCPFGAAVSVWTVALLQGDMVVTVIAY
jgi:hypothetical protein